MKFIKYHACGNDYVYVDCFSQTIDNPSQLAVKVSNRNFGIGSDGLILIYPSNKADAIMRIFNSDGSEARMCGNGLRCVSKFLFDEKKIKGEYVSIETLSGIKKARILSKSRNISQIEAEIGSPNNLKDMYFEKEQINSTIVSVGNPHCVIVCDEIDNIDIDKKGKKIQEHFPEGINVEFVKVESRDHIKIRVLERGSGETLSCGTGSCASVVSCIHNGLCNEKVTVDLRGGQLLIKYLDNKIYMSGEAVKVFEGVFYG